MTRRRRASTNAGSRSRLPTHTQCQDRSEHRRQRIEQHVVALVEGHRRNAEQRPAGRGPGGELGGVDAGLGDVHPVGGQRVQLQQPAPAPRAGRDDGGGGREDRAFPHPGVVASRRLPGGDPAACARARPSASRRACGTSTSGAVEATSPSSSTTASSGIRSTTPPRAANAAASGRGQQPGTACSCTDQPIEASPRQIRRS